MSQALFDREMALESEALNLGAASFRKEVEKARLKGRATQRGGAQTLLAHAFVEMEHLLEQHLATSVKKRGQVPLGVKAMRALLEDDAVMRELSTQARMTLAAGPSVVALLVCRVALDLLLKAEVTREPLPLKELMKTVAKEVADELRVREFRKQSPHLHQRMLEAFRTSSTVHMKRSLYAVMRINHIDDKKWRLSATQQMNVGDFLVGLFSQATGFLEYSERAIDPKGRPIKTRCVQLSARALAYIDDRNAAMESLWQAPRPMVVPPLPWAQGQRGGYLFGMAGRFPLVRGVGSKTSAKLESRDMPQVFSALNRLQETAWAVNTRVLDVMQALFDRGLAVAKLPAPVGDASDLPPCPQPDPSYAEEYRRWKDLPFAERRHELLSEDAVEYDRAFRHWKTMMRDWKDSQKEREGKRLACHRTLKMAQEMRHDAQFFFPYTCDFRGRVYPIVADLQPQGSDLAKGLLTFATAKTVTPAAAQFLAVHGANAMGKTLDGAKQKTSRMTIAERVAVITQATPMIEAIAEDPFTHMQWTEASDPVQFLAFCFEWAAYQAAQRRGESFASSLPVAVDGTCNALQLFALLFKDEEAGRQVNCVPLARPQDLYSAMADTVKDKLAEAAHREPLASLWLEIDADMRGLIDRDLVKQPVMTFGYGAVKAGFVSQLENNLKSRPQYEAIKRRFNDAQQSKAGCARAIRLLANIVWDALSERLPIGLAGREWMRAMGAAVAKQRGVVTWVTPLGFQMVQRYHRMRRTQVKLSIGGGFQPSVWTPDPQKPHIRKAANAISPNIIHSLDATAMLMTVNAAAAHGVTAFAMVHDSYGTHAADMAVLATALRQSFYTLFTQQDVLASMDAQLRRQMANTEEAPMPPAQGQMAIDGVLESTYFFS